MGKALGIDFRRMLIECWSHVGKENLAKKEQRQDRRGEEEGGGKYTC